MNLALTRNRFLADTVATAGPQQILTMLYDRLVLDLNRAELAQRKGERSQAADQLDHAQEIIASLASTLDVDAWSGGKGLMDLYMYLLRELVGASGACDADRTAACTALVVPLRDAWHEAAATTSARPAIPTQRPGSAFGESTMGGELGVG
jgi:flagellar protein FliS